MNLTVEVTPNGVKIPVSAFADNTPLEVVWQDTHVLVRPVQEEGQRFSVDPRRAQMEAEIAAFEVQHAKLVQTHLGKFVAFHNGELVDADLDPQQLRKRVRSQYKREVVMIQQVEASLPPLLRLGSMRQDRD